MDLSLKLTLNLWILRLKISCKSNCFKGHLRCRHFIILARLGPVLGSEFHGPRPARI